MSNAPFYHPHRDGFSLIEVSIVIVIIGLLVGGITVAQGMIEGARMQAVGKERAGLLSANHMFQEKYYSLPGDFKAAEGLWGQVAAGCANFSATGLKAGTCNGNGSGKLSTQETWGFWHHIALAGLMTHGYAGVHTAASVAIVAGANTPQSEWADNAGWVVNYVGLKSSDATYYDGNYGHVLILGDTSLVSAENGVMSGEQMTKLDVKFDDGEAATGDIRAVKITFASGCVSASDYVTTNDDPGCSVVWLTDF